METAHMISALRLQRTINSLTRPRTAHTAQHSVNLAAYQIEISRRTYHPVAMLVL